MQLKPSLWLCDAVCGRSWLFCMILYIRIDHAAYFAKVFLYIPIGKSQNVQMILFQYPCTRIIGGFCFFCVMLSSIQFYNQMCRMTVKIYYIAINPSLPIKLYRISP